MLQVVKLKIYSLLIINNNLITYYMQVRKCI